MAFLKTPIYPSLLEKGRDEANKKKLFLKMAALVNLKI